MGRGLSSYDEDQNDFVVANLFKTILETELKLKAKIFDEFEP